MNAYLRAALAATSLSLIFSITANAQDQDSAALFANMHPRKGHIDLANGIVSLNIGANFEYLNSNDATTLLTKILHNPPGSAEGNLGVILPTTKGEQWFAVISYSADGHVPDNDAASVNYDDLFKADEK